MKTIKLSTSQLAITEQALSVYIAATAILMGHTAAASPLCIDGHPAHRAAHVTYGGLPIKPGYERDHLIPLGLGGSDTIDNVQYQPWVEAQQKDKVEWRAVEGYCAGKLTLSQALEMVRNWRSE